MLTWDLVERTQATNVVKHLPGCLNSDLGQLQDHLQGLSEFGSRQAILQEVGAVSNVIEEEAEAASEFHADVIGQVNDNYVNDQGSCGHQERQTDHEQHDGGRFGTLTQKPFLGLAFVVALNLECLHASRKHEIPRAALF